MKSIRLIGLLLFSLLLAYGQESRGDIRGRVLDPSGASVPGASVSALNKATNVAVKTTSGDDGSYSLPLLNPGVYRLEAGVKGFQGLVQDGVELRVGDRLQIDLKMKVGEMTEQITVSAETPLLQTANASLGQVIDSQRISQLPTRDGSPMSLVFLSPGTTLLQATGSSLQAPTFMQNVSSVISVNGSPYGSTEFTLDGVSNMQTNYSVRSGIINSPPADLVQEFKMETAFDASVGHTSGAVVNMVLKSGGNQVHGTALFTYRSPGWQANSFISNRNGVAAGDFYYQRRSATLTGPVYIPKVYNGSNKTFFSFGYEQMDFGTPGVDFISSVPTKAQLGGDFSQLLQVGSQYQIYDPATTVPAANGRFSRTPFSGNLIPQNRLDKVGLAIANLYPAPNATNPRPDGTNNYAKTGYTDPRYYYNYVWRVDENLSDKQRLYLRFADNYRRDGPYRKYFNSPFKGETLAGPGWQAVVDDVYTVTPTLLVDVRYAFNRLAVGHSPDRLGHSPAELGFPSATVTQLTQMVNMYPQVSVDSLPGLGDEAATVLYGQNHSVMANATKQAGAHSFKFGIDVRSYTNYNSLPSASAGAFGFSSNWTKGPLDNSTSSPSGLGQGLASLLLGLPTSGNASRVDNSAATSTYWAAFFHDNWRVSNKLTLDLGVRWEYEGPLTERFNRAVRGFDFGYIQPIQAAAQAAYAANPDPALAANQFRLQGGLTYAGAKGQPRYFYDRAFLNFAPRVGFAYQWRKSTVVRGGFGTFPIELGIPSCGTTGGSGCVFQTGYTQTTQVVPTLDNGQTFIGTLANPFPTGLQAPIGNTLGAQTNLGQGITFYDTNTRTPYAMRWSMNIQQMLPGQWLLEVGYVGSKMIKLPVNNLLYYANQNLDATPLKYLSTTTQRDQTTINYLTFNIPNPMVGLLPGTSMNGASISRAQLLAPYPQFSSVTMVNYQGESWYNSLQLRAERRMSKGFTLIGSYTFSKLLDAMTYLNAGDPRPTQFVSTNDRPHVARLSGLFELPIGRGKSILTRANRALDSFVGGWTVGANWMITSGPPVFFTNPLLVNGSAADVVLPKSQRTLNHWFNTAAFNTVAAQQLSFNRVVITPYLGVRGDYETQLDLSVLKHVQIKERLNMELRGEFLNAPNHPTNFGPPNASPTSSAFGTVTAMNGTPRVVQVMLKLLF